MFQEFSFTFNQSILIAFYSVIVGYYFLLFAYFLVIRFLKTKRMYWLFFSIFFLLLSLSGVFFIINDFYIPQPQNLLSWRIATMFGWIAVACMVEILAILMFTGDQKWVRNVKICLPLIYVGVAVVVLVLPDTLVCEGCSGVLQNAFLQQSFNISYPEGRFWLNVVILPMTTTLFPILFFYLGIKQ